MDDIIPIIAETDDYLLVWKEANLAATPTARHPDSLIIRLIKSAPRLSDVKGYKSEEYGLLNRLDNRTSGLLMVAKTQEAFEKLSAELKSELWTKTYLAYCYNLGLEEKGFIDLPIAHHLNDPARMVIARENAVYRGKPQPCVTSYEKISAKQAEQLWTKYLKGKISFPDLPKSENRFAWLLCRIKRGKRHQIRLHLSSAGYPILGDNYYKPAKKYRTEYREHYALYAISLSPHV